MQRRSAGLVWRVFTKRALGQFTEHYHRGTDSPAQEQRSAVPRPLRSSVKHVDNRFNVASGGLPMYSYPRGRMNFLTIRVYAALSTTATVHKITLRLM